MEKNKQNQDLKSSKAISLFAVLAVGVYFLAPLLNNKDAALRKNTILKAEGIAYQLLESRKSVGRGPASLDSALSGVSLAKSEEGSLGSDSWGHPFQFRVVTGSHGSSKLLVWSLGPNGQAETSEKEIVSNQDKIDPEFAGDDLGIMLSIK